MLFSKKIILLISALIISVSLSGCTKEERVEKDNDSGSKTNVSKMKEEDYVKVNIPKRALDELSIDLIKDESMAVLKTKILDDGSKDVYYEKEAFEEFKKTFYEGVDKSIDELIHDSHHSYLVSISKTDDLSEFSVRVDASEYDLFPKAEKEGLKTLLLMNSALQESVLGIKIGGTTVRIINNSDGSVIDETRFSAPLYERFSRERDNMNSSGYGFLSNSNRDEE